MFFQKARDEKKEIDVLKREKVVADQEKEAARLDLQLSLRRLANHLSWIPIEKGVIELGEALAPKKGGER